MRIVSSLDAFKRTCIISFTPSSQLHLSLLSLVHMYSFTYFLYVFYMCTGMCINGHVYFISLFIYLFFCLCLCSTCVHVCVYGHGRAAFWLNGHDLTLNIEHCVGHHLFALVSCPDPFRKNREGLLETRPYIGLSQRNSISTQPRANVYICSPN